MSAIIIPLRTQLAHLWVHPTRGGWVAVTADRVDPFWPAIDAEWVSETSAARFLARRLAAEHNVPLLTHGEEF